MPVLKNSSRLTENKKDSRESIKKDLVLSNIVHGQITKECSLVQCYFTITSGVVPIKE